jgi:acyl-coenzyme A thioesterase PaaI-like protein
MTEGDDGKVAYGELATGLEQISAQFAVSAWKVLAESPGYVKIRVPLLPRLKNRRQQLFGGYTPAYVDMLAYRVARSGSPDHSDAFVATTSMRIDYLEALTGDYFEVECQLLKARGRNAITEARFFQDGALAVFAVTTMLALANTTEES